jgi:fibronectin-binding autotransporter adhesin
MSEKGCLGGPGLPLDEARVVDKICDDFEGRWAAGGRPSIADYLGAATDALWPALLQELIQIELFIRCRQGEPIQSGTYLTQFPQLNAAWLDEAIERQMALAASPAFRVNFGRDQQRAPPTAAGGFGDYKLIEEIARGGMGVVYKARQASLNRTVAVKMILAGELATPAEVDRFHAEAQAAANLDHPGIVPIFEVGEAHGQHYFSMGYVEGRSLAERLADGPLPARDAAKLVRQLCDAVQYAHERHVVHLLATEELGVGGLKNGAFTQSGGTVLAGGGPVVALLLMGTTGYPSATYNLQGGLLSVTGQDYIGDLGIGSFVQSGGTHSVSSGTLLLGSSVLGLGGTGTYDLSVGNLSVPTEYVAYYGTGSFIQSGGTHNVTSSLFLGYNTGSSGSYNLSGAGQLNASFYEYVGWQGKGSFTQSSGVNAMQVLYLAGYTNSSGTYSLSGGGVLNNTGGEYVGFVGSGSFTQSGGVNNAYYLTLGAASTAQGSYTLSGGLLNGVPGEDIGYVGSGTFIQSGGTNNAGQLSLAPFGGSGSYTLGGGLLNLYSLSRGTGTTAFSIGAGTLQAGASFATSVPITLSQPGGTAVFDSDGNALTLNGALSGPGGVEKIGTGTLTLAVSNGYSGPTTLVAGLLVAANGNSGSATGSNSVTLNGGVLAAGAAGGTITGPVLAGSAAHTIAPGAALSSGYGTLNLFGGLTTNVYTTLLYNMSPSSLGILGGNSQPIYGGDLINLNHMALTVSGGNNQGGQIAFTVNPTQPGDYRLFYEAGGNPNLSGLNLPSQSGMVYTLSTTVDNNYIDLVAIGAALGASSGTWVSPVSGNWTVPGNWSGSQVPSSGTVFFPAMPPGAPITVWLDGSQSAGALMFNANGNGYTLAQGSGGALSLGTSAEATITVGSGDHIISAPMVLEGNLTVNVAAGASLQLSGAISQAAAGLGLALNGPGLLVFSGTGAYVGGTTINSGTLQINAGGSLPANNEYVGTGAADAYLIQNGGVNTVAAGGNLQGLIVGYGSGNAYYNLNGGLLSAQNEFISWNGVTTFTQTSGTNQAGYLSVGTFYNGAYNLSGGLISASAETIGTSGYNGTLSQTGGTNQTSSLIVGNLSFYGGTYDLNGGYLACGTEYVGYSGTGTFTQSGGTHAVGELYLAEMDGSVGTYNLDGGLLSLSSLYQGDGAASFNVGGGTFQAASSFATSVPITLSTLGSNGVFDTDGNTLTLGGPVSGPGGLIATGTGTLVLSGTNTYGGGTVVLDGTLVVTNNEGLADGSSLFVGDPSLFAVAAPAIQVTGNVRAVPEPSALALLAAAAAVPSARRIFQRRCLDPRAALG